VEGSDCGVIEALFWHLLGGTEVNHEYLSGYLVSRSLSDRKNWAATLGYIFVWTPLRDKCTCAQRNDCRAISRLQWILGMTAHSVSDCARLEVTACVCAHENVLYHYFVTFVCLPRTP
jgi:hypothetical protein